MITAVLTWLFRALASYSKILSTSLPWSPGVGGESTRSVGGRTVNPQAHVSPSAGPRLFLLSLR